MNEAGLGVGTFGPEGEAVLGGEFEGTNVAEGWRIFFEHPIVSVKGDAFDIESADHETPSGVSAGWETFSCGILSIVEGCESIETDREIIFGALANEDAEEFSVSIIDSEIDHAFDGWRDESDFDSRGLLGWRWGIGFGEGWGRKSGEEEKKKGEGGADGFDKKGKWVWRHWEKIWRVEKRWARLRGKIGRVKFGLARSAWAGFDLRSGAPAGLVFLLVDTLRRRDLVGAGEGAE